MKQRIMVTGAGGFVGRNLSEYFLSKPDAYVLIPVTHAELDLLDSEAVAESLRKHAPDVVIHCASTGGSRKTGYDSGASGVFYSNLRMFFNLARALPTGTRMISMGSGAEYDMRSYRSKMREEYFDTSVPSDDYGYAKYVISKYIQATPNVVCLRIFGLYGKYEDYRFKFISNAIVKNLLKLPIVINQDVNFDYLYIKDFVHIVEYFVKAQAPKKHYNVTPSKSYSLTSLAAAVEACGSSEGIRVLNGGMNAEYSGDNARLLEFIGAFQFTPPETAIAELRKFYSDNLSSLDLGAVRQDEALKYCRTRKGPA